MLQAEFVDAPVSGEVADTRCGTQTLLWSAGKIEAVHAFDGNTGTAAFANSGNDLGICERLTFEIDVEFEIDPAATGGWSNTALTTFGVDLNADGTPDVTLQDISDGDGNPLLDSDPTGAGPTADPGDDPTRVPLARLGLAKSFLPDPDPVPGMAPFFDYTVQLAVQNIGEVPLTGLRLVDDDVWNEWYDVAAERPGAMAPYAGAAIMNGPVLINQSNPNNLSLAAALNTNLASANTLGQTTKPAWVGHSVDRADPRVTLLNGGQLAVGESFTLQFVVRFNPFAFELPLEGFLGNQAQVIAEEADPDNPAQARFAGIYTFDQSDSGFDPSSDNTTAPRLQDEPNTFENPSPLPNPAPPQLRLTKRALPDTLEVGEQVRWQITVENLSVIPAIDVDVVDVLPAGFAPVESTYQVDNSAATSGTTPQVMQLDAGNFPVPDGFTGVTIDGVSVTNQGSVLVFEDVDLNPGDAVVFTFQTAATIGLDVGTYINQAYAIDGKWQADDQLVSSTVAQGSVTVQPSAVFDCATIIGQVFRDEDGNGYQSLSERGIPAARISTLVAGTTLVITTDQNGLFHLPCSVIPNQDRGTNVVLKLDPETLPSGYRITTENPRAIRVTRGKTSKANFGASLDRVVRLDLNHCAFVGTSANLNRQAKVGLSGLIGKLKE